LEAPSLILASISLLVKNAERYLPDILDAIFNQQFEAGFEVFAIDSGSTDSTIEVLSTYPIKILRIPPEEFGHGTTRNLAVKKAHSEAQFIVFLSQDAVPKDDDWLANLIAPLHNDKEVAGSFSRHLPRDDASPSLARQLTINWQTGGAQRIVKVMPDNPDEYETNKFHYIYFSNTSSAIRRSVWDDHPFLPVDFAEDADWADRVLRAGHKLVFEPSSIVIHSHDYGFVEQFRQNIDHTNAMVQLFNPHVYRKRWVWIKLFLNIPREVWKDWRFQYLSEFHMNSTLRQSINWIIWSPFWHLASVLGGCIGANLQRVPKPLRILFSRQERIRRGSKNR
jgi:rhamnosyltransferase